MVTQYFCKGVAAEMSARLDWHDGQQAECERRDRLPVRAPDPRAARRRTRSRDMATISQNLSKSHHSRAIAACRRSSPPQ
jgi:hypothetical protein